MIYFLILLIVTSSEARRAGPIAKVYDSKGYSDVPSKNDGTCRTKTCYRIANSYLSSMDETVNPCDNFYNFACGNWKHRSSSYPGYGSLYDEIQKLTMLARDRLRHELKKASSPDEILPIKQMKKLYKSCMEMNQTIGVASINEILNRLNGWPMVMEADSWNTINAHESIKWQEIDSYYEQLMGLNAFYKVEMENSPNEYGVLMISKEENPLDDLFFVRWFAAELMKYNGIEVDDIKLDREIEELRNFAEEINKVHETRMFYRSPDIASFLKWWNDDVGSSEQENSIDWRNFFDRLLNIVNIPNIWNTPILLENIEYYTHLSRILESTDKRIIVNFIHSHFILRRRSMFHEGNTVLCGGTGVPRWLDCLHEREPAVAHLFIKNHYQNHTGEAVDQMIQNFEDAYEHQIKNSNWLPDEEKDNAIELVKELEYIMGYEEWYTDESTLIDYYKHLTIDDNYPKNIYRLKKHEWVKNIQYWGRPTKEAKWSNSVVEVNGETFYFFKSIIIPAATLQSPLIAPTLPHYVTYGGVGNVIGHEMGHWFDSNDGSFFGRLNDTTYKPIFKELSQCFIDLIDSYTAGSGDLTLPENLADWYGMQAVYHAYKELREKQYENGEQKLPGLQKYNDHQMFFLSHSQLWCGAESYNWDHDDVHQAGAIRVLATLSQTAAFAEAFECPENSPMNPEKKCNMWMKEPDTL